MDLLPEVSVSAMGEITVETPTKYQKKPLREVDLEGWIEDPAMADLREHLLKTKHLATYGFDDLTRMYWHLRDYVYARGVQHRYNEALESQKLLEYLRIELNDRRVSALTKGAFDSFRTTLDAKEYQYVSAGSRGNLLSSD
jgi:hypothetical protein